jgi:hypothetical protein
MRIPKTRTCSSSLAQAPSTMIMMTWKSGAAPCDSRTHANAADPSTFSNTGDREARRMLRKGQMPKNILFSANERSPWQNSFHRSLPEMTLRTDNTDDNASDDENAHDNDKMIMVVIMMIMI